MSETLSTSEASAPRPEPTWRGEHPADRLAEDAEQRAGHRPRLLGQRAAERLHRGLRDRLDQHLPHVGGADDPLGPAPGRGRGDAGGELGGRVEPVVGEPERVGDGVLLLLASATGRGTGPRSCGPVSSAKSQFTGPSCGCIRNWSWLKSWLRSGIPPPARRVRRPNGAEDLLERRALEGVLPSSGVSPGLSFMTSTVRGAWSLA